MNIIQACNILRNEAKAYKGAYDKLVIDRDVEIKKVRETYIRNTPAHRKAILEIESRFYESIADAQTAFSTSGMRAIDALRDLEYKRTGEINKDKLAKLREISDIPMTFKELDVVMDIFGVEGDYWAEKMCEAIAAKNGFDIKVSPSYEKRMNVLDELQDQMEKIIKDYPAKDSDAGAEVRFLYLNDSVLRNAVKMYCGKDWLETAADKASQIYLEILRGTSELDRARLLKKALENPNEEVRKLVLCHVATRGDLSDFTIEFSRHSGEIQAFRDGRATEYMAAIDAISRLEKTEDKVTAERILREHEDNRYIPGLLEAAKKCNAELKELLPDERDMTREEWIGNLQREYLEAKTGETHSEDTKNNN